SSTFTLSFFSKAVVILGGVFGVVIMLECCPVVQFPKGGDHALLHYVTAHDGIHGSLNELSACFQQTVCRLSCASSLEEASFWGISQAYHFVPRCSIWSEL
ncbi:hypothetical protein GOODEAATRI_013893, partial [Goodea atripinnis]